MNGLQTIPDSCPQHKSRKPMQLKQSAIEKFLSHFKQECDKLGLALEIVSSCYLGSHYYLGKITIDRQQIEEYIESSNGDPLQVWRVVCYHEFGHGLGHVTEESCWDWLERQPA